MINIDNKFQLRLLEEKINNLLNEKVILKNKSEIITKHFKEGKYENEYSNYITQLISIRSAVSNNEYSINTAKLKLSSLKKTITNQENSETKSEIKLFETGKINKVTKKIKKEKRLLNKYPMAIYVLVIIVDIFVFILLIVFFRSLEEIRFRTKNKWCNIKTDKYSGWIKNNNIWGFAN